MIYLLIQTFEFSLEATENVITSYIYKVFSKVSMHSPKLTKLSEYLVTSMKELTDDAKTSKIMDDLLIDSQEESVTRCLRSLFQSDDVDDIDFCMKLYAIMLRKTDKKMASKIVRSISKRNFDDSEDAWLSFSPAMDRLLKILDHFWSPFIMTIHSQELNRWKNWIQLNTQTFDLVSGAPLNISLKKINAHKVKNEFRQWSKLLSDLEEVPYEDNGWFLYQ